MFITNHQPPPTPQHARRVLYCFNNFPGPSHKFLRVESNYFCKWWATTLGGVKVVTKLIQITLFSVGHLIHFIRILLSQAFCRRSRHGVGWWRWGHKPTFPQDLTIKGGDSTNENIKAISNQKSMSQCHLQEARQRTEVWVLIWQL